MKKSDRIKHGFAKLGGKVIAQTVAGAKTVGNNQNGVQLTPQLQSRRAVIGKRRTVVLAQRQSKLNQTTK